MLVAPLVLLTLLRFVYADAPQVFDRVGGPLLALFPFDDEAAALRQANAAEFGLASYVFTGGLDRAFHAARRIEAGMVGVNTGVISNAANPFGGIKQSGFGREGGPEGIQEYLDTKYVAMNL